MKIDTLKDTISQIFEKGKGILAMDESISTCNKRFAAVDIPQTVEMRRRYRELIVTTKGLHESIGGAILCDETIRQETRDGVSMADVLVKAGIIPGIKVDEHAKPLAGFPNEKVTEGLDGLRERLSEYKKLGARFAKWRAVIQIDKDIPTIQCIEANAYVLCRYAALCQEAGIVPIVEPEVLMDGNHTMEQCHDVTVLVLKTLFHMLYKYRVHLEGMILKPNMILQGKERNGENTADEVAQATVNGLLEAVPASVPAIAFLSGGQSPKEATAHLNAIHKNYKNQLPWIVAFSFARAIQQPALKAWKGKDDHMEEAQKILYTRAKYSSAACQGKYDPAIEE